MREVAFVGMTAPFRWTRRRTSHRVGTTLGEILAAERMAGRPGVTVSINGLAVPEDLTACPVPGAVVTAVEVPQNVASLAALVLSPQAALQAAAGIPGGPTVEAYFGADLFRSFFLIALPGSPEAEDGTRSPTGSRNRLPQYEPVLQVLGEPRLFPDQAATSYLEVVGKDLYQRLLFSFGPGPLELSELRIGDDPLFKEATALQYTGKMTADGKFDDIEVELREGRTTDPAITLFSGNVTSQSVNVQLQPDNPLVRRSPEGITEFTVIIAFPDGLLRAGKENTYLATVRVKVSYRRADSDDTWTTEPLILAEAKTRSAIFFKRRVTDLEEGAYDIRIERATAAAALGVVDRSVWHSTQTQRPGTPVALPGICLVAMRAKLTDQFAQAIDTFNAKAALKTLDWNGAAWVEATTRNPAALVRHILQGRSNLRPVPDAKLDLASFQDWHDECAAAGRTYSFVHRQRMTVLEASSRVALVGRGSIGVVDGKISIVRDLPVTSIVQRITPRNSHGFRAVRTFPRLPDALKVRFIDHETDDQETERIVPRDGFTEATAADFERFDLMGAEESDQAWKEGRYHLAVLSARPEVVYLSLDFEHFSLTRGDPVAVTHDVLQHGLASGRVKARTPDGGGNLLSIDVDEDCPMEPAKSYAVVVRLSDGTAVTAAVDTVPGENATLTFSTPIPAANPQPQVDDLFQFGIAGQVSATYVVSGIARDADLGCELRLLPEAPGVHTADTGAIPAFNPHVSVRPALPGRRPGKPRLGRDRTRSRATGPTDDVTGIVGAALVIDMASGAFDRTSRSRRELRR